MVRLNVSGMVCEGCAQAVRRALASRDPNASVTVSRDSGMVEADTTLSVAEAIEAIEGAGYEASAAAN